VYGKKRTYKKEKIIIFFSFLALKKPKTAFLRKFENEIFFLSKKLFQAFSINKSFISKRNPKQILTQS
jgi:hypothetical protein